MRVHLTTLTFDLDGSVSIDILPTSDMGTTTRRVNRTATLDGGVAVNDYGHSQGDRTITLRWRSTSRDHEASIVRLVQLYSRLNIATDEGLFLVAPETYRTGAAESSLVLLVLEKLA